MRPPRNSRIAAKAAACLAAAIALLPGCKEQVARHIEAEPDATQLVALTYGPDSPSLPAPGSKAGTSGKRIELELNIWPRPDQQLEQDVIQHVIEMFEKKHPNIKIHLSPWRFTPESFFESAAGRSLTDIVEVDASQIPPILDVNAAADLTDQVKASERVKDLNPEVLKLVTRNSRVYGMPVELHSMALFFNRRLMKEALRPPPAPKPAATPVPGPAPTRRPPARRPRGDDSEPRDFLADQANFVFPIAATASLPDETPDYLRRARALNRELKLRPELIDGQERLLAQGYGYQNPNYYGQQEEQQPSRRTRRQSGYDAGSAAPPYGRQPAQYGGQAYPSYYPQQPQQQPQQPRRRGFMNWFRGDEDPGQSNVPDQSSGYRQADPEADPNARRRRTTPDAQPRPDDEYEHATDESRRNRRTDPDDPESAAPSDKRRNSAIDKDIVTDAAETTETKVEDTLSTVVETVGLPDDWDGFIKVAAKITDQDKSIYGYAPVLFAQEGGREFTQWAVQAGLQLQVPLSQNPVGGDSAPKYVMPAKLDVNTSPSAEVAQFIKDLHWRYDISPPPAQCYFESLLKLFAQGKVGMMMLPADRETITRLLRLGMSLDDLGIAEIPAGPQNAKQLVYGRFAIVNSQVDPEKRAAAFQWLIFQLDPEVTRLRETTMFREKEWSGEPHVPLFRADLQASLHQSLHAVSSLPVFSDYNQGMARAPLALEPPYFKERFYEALADGIRLIVDRKDSDPMTAVASLGADFEKRYLQAPPDPQGWRRYLDMLPRIK